MALTSCDIRPGFARDLAALPGTDNLGRCFDCGSCTAVCPVSEACPGLFDPRRILHMIRLGLTERLMSSQEFWYCSHCDTCRLACPQEVHLGDIMHALRHMALGEVALPGRPLVETGTSPCKAACPAHISIPGFISAILAGKPEDGIRLIKEELPFPGICGRICPHPCETACNRSQVDSPVAIESLKRFLADQEVCSPSPYVPRVKTPKSQKVAVVGSGPAGLTAAYYLAIEGYRVTVYERLPVAGGMMAVAIPEFRLPRRILDAEIETVRCLGVEIRLNVNIGKDVDLAALRNSHDAVFLGVGCHRSYDLGIQGEALLEGIVDGLTFLREVSLGKRPDPRERAVVVGGGNTALDCARVARRLGYPQVEILYRRTREEMPAHEWEIRETLEEGIKIRYLSAPVKALGDDGRVTAMECLVMRLGEPDASGRRRPIPLHGSEFTVKADLVIKAVGQGADLELLMKQPDTLITKNGLIAADPTSGLTPFPGLFAGGDGIYGPRTVVEAVASGKAAAKSIDHYLKGEKEALSFIGWKGLPFRSSEAVPAEREQTPVLSPRERVRGFSEIAPGFTPKQAVREASRCLRICGLQGPECKGGT